MAGNTTVCLLVYLKTPILITSHVESGHENHGRNGARSVVSQAKELIWQTGNITEVATQRFEDPIDDKGVVYTIHSGKFDCVAVERSMAHHRLKDHRAEPGDTSEKLLAAGCITLYRDPADLLQKYDSSPLKAKLDL